MLLHVSLPILWSGLNLILSRRHDGDDLATLLKTSSLLYVKRYGNHGLASVSVRGMSGSHTLVTWNGMTINTPGNGYSDFSVIPLMAVTSVRITSGGSDLDDLTGYIGGKVELDTDPRFGSGKEASVSLAAGSYSDYTSAASLSFGGDRTYVRMVHGPARRKTTSDS